MTVSGDEDGQRGHGRPPFVELEDREADQGMAGEVGALAEELPCLGRLGLGCQSAYRVIHVSEESVGVHRALRSGNIPDFAYAKLNTRYKSHMSSTGQAKTWTFLTNHAQVLLCLAEDPDIRLRDVAERVGITERATQRILAELVDAGYVTAARVGRRNHYVVDREHAMRHSAQLGYEIGTLLRALSPD